MRRMCVGWMKSLKEEWLRVTVQKWCDTDVRGGGNCGKRDLERLTEI